MFISSSCVTRRARFPFHSISLSASPPGVFEMSTYQACEGDRARYMEAYAVSMRKPTLLTLEVSYNISPGCLLSNVAVLTIGISHI